MAGRKRGPGCYRVMLKGEKGAVWGPIVEAVDPNDAMAKAVHLFPHCTPVGAAFQHNDSQHRGEHHELRTVGDVLDAKVSQARLVDRRRDALQHIVHAIGFAHRVEPIDRRRTA